MHLFGTCLCTISILNFLTRILSKAVFLSNGTIVELLIFKDYPIDSMKIISLIFLWRFMYTEKFSNGFPNIKAFAHAYKRLISVVAEMHITNLLGASEMIKILNFKLKI